MTRSSTPTLTEYYNQITRGYTILEYIESTGTQYIDTGYTPSNNTHFRADIYLVGTQHDMFGAFGSNWTTNSFGCDGTGSLYDSYLSDTAMGFSAQGKRFVYDKNNNVTTVTGGVSWTKTYTAKTFTAPSTLYLFKCNITMSRPGTSMRLYSCKIWNSGILVRNFIPVMRNKDYNVGLYDTVNGVFYENKGTGAFTAGAGYTELEYIESTGTQYIDTGVLNDGTTLTIESNALFKKVASRQLMGTDKGGWFGVTASYNFEPASVTMANDFNFHVFKLISTKGINHELTVDGTSLGATSDPGTANYYVCVFCLNCASFSSGYGFWSQAKVKTFKVWKDDELVRNLIPVKRNTDSAIGLYDLVTNTFFENKGTGTFVAGPEVSSSAGKMGYKLLSYLETTKTQYLVVPGKAWPSDVSIYYTASFFGDFTPASSRTTLFSTKSNGTYVFAQNFGGGTGQGGTIYNWNSYPYTSSSWPFTSFTPGTADTVHHFRCNAVSPWYIDSTAVTVQARPDAYTMSGMSIFILGNQKDSVPFSGYYARLRSFQIFSPSTGNLVDLIPALRLYDAKPGMYDVLNNVFYTNIGTGEFNYKIAD